MLRVARRYGIPKTTLLNRLHGSGNRRAAYQEHQRLSPMHEERIATWIIRQEALGYAPSYANVQAVASAILAKGGNHEPLRKR